MGAPAFHRLEDIDRKLAEWAEKSLAEFCKQAWHIVEPATPLVWGWHLDAVCEHLEAVAAGQIQNLLLNEPPGHSKSLFVSVFWPAWMWLPKRRPDWRVIAASYADSLVLRDAVKMRQIVESEWYRDGFEVDWTLQADLNQKHYFQNTKTGFRISTTVGGQGTGHRGHCLRGDTLVATERGSLRIEALVRMSSPPRVWSLNHGTGRLELKRVEASRAIPDQPVTRLVTRQGRELYCTREHGVFSDGQYRSAARLRLGAPLLALRVPGVRSAGLPAQRQADPLSSVRDRDADLRLRGHFSASARGVGEAPAAGLCPASLLYQGMRISADDRSWPGAEWLSHDPPQVEVDALSLAEPVCNSGVTVYDLQVEGNRNFFANGVLVHNCILVDDPMKAEDAFSKPARDAVISWWKYTIANRLNDMATGARVVVMQRLHEDDLAGHLLREEGPNWEHLMLPSQYESKRRSVTYIRLPPQNEAESAASIELLQDENAEIPPLRPRGEKLWEDPRQKEGELLFPGKFPAPVLAVEKRRLGSIGYPGQHQQRPTASEGGMFKRPWWRFWRRMGEPDTAFHPMLGDLRPKTVILPDKFDEMALSWDCAFKGTQDSDKVAGGCWGRAGALKFLLDLQWDVMDFVETLRRFKAQAEKFPRARLKIIEEAANGPAVISMFRSKIAGIVGVTPMGGKEARAAAASPEVEAGNVIIPLHAPWRDAYIDEHASFPLGSNDDAVDQQSQMLARWVGTSDLEFLRAMSQR